MNEKQFNWAIIICIAFGICAIGYFLVFQPRAEGDPHFIFTEVPAEVTANNPVIHLEDKDILNIRGIEVQKKNGKLTSIYFRYSETTPEISDQEFNSKYGSYPGDPTLRKYIEYDRVYYYALELKP